MYADGDILENNYFPYLLYVCIQDTDKTDFYFLFYGGLMMCHETEPFRSDTVYTPQLFYTFQMRKQMFCLYCSHL